jgi:hypothetical protein
MQILGAEKLPLEKLTVSQCNFDDAAFFFITRIKTIVKLEASDTSVHDDGVGILRELPSLEYLNLATSINMTSKALESLSGCRHLKALYLNHDQIADGIKFLRNTNITELCLAKTNVGNDQLDYLAQMPHLTNLDLTNTQVTDDGLPALYKARQLSHLSVAECKLTLGALEKLRKKLPGCHVESEVSKWR